jgi:predicted GIY-YIG superfamily endonuclease
MYHPATGIFYIGRTNDLTRRVKAHMSALRCGRHENASLQEAFNDSPDFEWTTYEVIETFEDAVSGELRLIKLNSNDPKLVNLHGVNGWPAGVREAVNNYWTPERRANWAARRKGIIFTEAHKEAISNGHLGKKLSTEHISKSCGQNKINIMGEGIFYPSKTAAATALNLDLSTILYRVKSQNAKWAGWYELPNN